jgi:hypothetical protein
VRSRTYYSSPLIPFPPALHHQLLPHTLFQIHQFLSFHPFRSHQSKRSWALSTLEEPRDNRSALPHSRRLRLPAPASAFSHSFTPSPPSNLSHSSIHLCYLKHLTQASNPTHSQVIQIRSTKLSAPQSHFHPPYRTLKQPKLFRTPRHHHISDHRFEHRSQYPITRPSDPTYARPIRISTRDTPPSDRSRP